MPAPSLFCPHKRLVSVCPVCGSARAGAATPVRAAVRHDPDDTIHRFRLACHARLARYLALAHAGAPPQEAYFGAYDAWTRRGRVASEEEDPSTLRGGLYRAVVKMFDVTIDDRRIQGYNGLADWDEMRDYVFRKLSPDELDAAIASKRLLIHGGNGAWARQQIATELLRADDAGPAALHVAFGADGASAVGAADAEIVRRLAHVESAGRRLGAKGTIAWSSKILHAMAPARWAPVTPRATSEVGDELGVAIPEVREAADYPAFNAAMLALARDRGLPDLARADMLVADTWESLQADDGEE